MFPKEIRRVQYLVRLLILIVSVGVIAALTVPLLHLSDEPSPLLYLLPVIVFLVVVPIRLAALDIPRIRSIGWSPWLLLLFLIPGINAIMQILLLVMPPKST
ncbi:hypothetical protein DB347_09525 [Opitutaceae bacterium EW11]|nr:hypothetical protein DB347_09525 [Opitutaceae bacterium EW11]